MTCFESRFRALAIGARPRARSERALRAGATHRRVAGRQDAGDGRVRRRRPALRGASRRRQRRHALAARLRLQGRRSARRQPAHRRQRRAHLRRPRGRSRGARSRGCATTTTSCGSSVAETTAPRRRFDVVVPRRSTTAWASATSCPTSRRSATFEITDELTEFTLADDARAWWIPSNRPRLDRSEMLYSSSPVSVIDSVQTPLTMEIARRHDVRRDPRGEPRGLCADEPRAARAWRTARCARRWRPWADGVKVRGRTPFVTPWRTIQLADRVERSRAVGARAQPQSAERHRRHRAGSSR